MLQYDVVKKNKYGKEYTLSAKHQTENGSAVPLAWVRSGISFCPSSAAAYTTKDFLCPRAGRYLQNRKSRDYFLDYVVHRPPLPLSFIQSVAHNLLCSRVVDTQQQQRVDTCSMLTKSRLPTQFITE